MRTMLPTLMTRQASPLVPLLRDFDRLFEALQPWNEGEESSLMALAPRMDVAETAAGLEVTLEVAGVTENDIDVQVQDKTLTVRGEKRREHSHGSRDVSPKAKDKAGDASEQGPTWHISERSYGRFSRTLTLPFAPEADAVQATFKHGVLYITLPRPANDPSQAKRIAVKSS